MPKSRAARVAKGQIEESDREHIDAGEAPKKRKKGNSRGASSSATLTRKPRKNSKIGRLALLLQMPLDVFNEIAGHLSPGDLLILARSTKFWRGLLMSRNSKPIWRAARNNVGLPDCPDDLSEPRYADLLYGRGCMICHSPRAKNIYFAFRLRLCKRCFKENAKNRIYCLKAAMMYVTYEQAKELCEMAPVHDESNTRWHEPMYLEEGFLESIEDYISLHPDEKEEFIHTSKARAAQINTHARLIEEWIFHQEVQNENKRAEVGTRFYNGVMSRLRGLGYNEDDLDIDCDRWSYLIWEPKKLTERVWTRIKPELEEIITTHRQRKQLALLCKKFLDGEELTSQECASLIVEYLKWQWNHRDEDVGVVLY